MAEFDTIRAPNESTMICYFWKDLKPFIKVKIEQQDWTLTSFKEMMQKVVNVEAKASLSFSIIIRDTDFRYLRDHCLFQNTSTKVQIQGSNAKKSKLKESRLKDLKPANKKTPALLHTNEPRKISHQDKKKEYFKKKQDRKNSTPAIGDNTIEGEKKRNN